MLMSQLDPGNQVFLVGTTNHIDNIDPRVLRGGRFTEKIEIGVPDDQGYLRLIDKYLGPIPLAAGLDVPRSPGSTKGHFAGGSAGPGEHGQTHGDESHEGRATKPCPRSSGTTSSTPSNEPSLVECEGRISTAI